MVASSLVVRLTTEPTGSIVWAHGAIDLRSSPSLRQQLLTLADRNPPRVIVDLSRVTYVDSSGVGTLVEFKRRMDRTHGGRVVLAGLQPRVRGVLEMARLDNFFTIATSVEEARQTLPAPPAD